MSNKTKVYMFKTQRYTPKLKIVGRSRSAGSLDCCSDAPPDRPQTLGIALLLTAQVLRRPSTTQRVLANSQSLVRE